VPIELPPGLDIRWLGVSGYCLTYEGATLFIDPYVSRIPLRSLPMRRKALPNPAMLDAYAQAPASVVGLLVGHTHFDHAVDAPAIAARHRAPAYGSSSLAHLMALHGLGDLAVEVEPHRRYELGPFASRSSPAGIQSCCSAVRCRWAGR
jgi:L-ascorbate metabolism protein UlaG (beta-lactamase superfamily)